MAEADAEIIVYGNGAYFADHPAHARIYPATSDVAIWRARMTCRAETMLDADRRLADQPQAVQALAHRYLPELQIEALPDSIGEPMAEELAADLLYIASGFKLLRAIEGRCHGYPAGEPGEGPDQGFMPLVAVTAEGRRILQEGGIQARPGLAPTRSTPFPILAAELPGGSIATGSPMLRAVSSGCPPTARQLSMGSTISGVLSMTGRASATTPRGAVLFEPRMSWRKQPHRPAAAHQWRDMTGDAYADDSRVAWVLRVLDERVEVTREMTAEHAHDPAWREAFDATGWSNAPRIAAAAMLTNLITEIAERVLAKPSSPEAAPDLRSQQVRRR